MAIEGQLTDVGLADILQLLAMGRKTGCLRITDRSNFGYIYLDQGRVIHANVLNRPNRIGDLLVRNRVIDRGQLVQAIEQQSREPGRRLGEILVEGGAITAEQLLRHITVQVEEAVYHLFGWDQGSFHFEPDARPEEDTTAHVSIPAENLLLEGARRVDEWSQMARKIPAMDLVFMLERTPTNTQLQELSEAQRKLLELLDGVRSVEELVEASGLVEFECAKALFGLIQAGFARHVGRKSPSIPLGGGDAGARAHRLGVALAYERAGMASEAAKAYREVLELAPEDPEAHGRLAVLELRGGRPQVALEHFLTLPTLEAGRFENLLHRALALELLNRLPEALEVLEMAGQLRSTDPHLHLARGVVLLKLREVERALEALESYRTHLPAGELPSPLYHAYGILAHVALGDRGGALRLGQEGLTLHPGSGPILVNLGAVLAAGGDAPAAETLFLRALASHPVPPQAHRHLGDLALARGDRPGARAHYERLLRLDPTSGDAVHFRLGRVAWEEGDTEAAERHWREALALNPDHAEARAHLEHGAGGARPPS